MLQIAMVAQFLWALLLTGMYALGAFQSPGGRTMIAAVLAAVYLASTVGAFFRWRLAWALALLMPMVVLARWVPMIALNCFLFATGHELYRDSPGTIIVVFISGVVFIVPPLLIYLLILAGWKQLRSVLRPGTL